MKNGICPMCKSDEVYMTGDKLNLDIGDGRGLSFSAGEGRASDVYYFDTYVCLSCGYTAMFAKASLNASQGLAPIKMAKGWRKAGQPARPRGG
jgi:hypothetical protein